MTRPAVDIVVPFRGDQPRWRGMVQRLDRIRLRPGDSLTFVDNTGTIATDDPRALPASEYASSYYARNTGAARGTGEWILFLDADVVPDDDLLDRYFDPPPDATTGVVAGGIVDIAPEGGNVAVRYAALKQAMSHETVLRGEWAFAQTANCAVRRSAFTQVGGFVTNVRSGGDADLAYRLKRAGWKLEVRAAARVTHLNRTTLRAMLAQRARHGSGAAWLESRYPGSFPPRRKLGLVRWSLRSWLSAAQATLNGDRDAALVAWLDPLAVWAFELGRSVPIHARARRTP